jgi:hypothetical protein
MIPGYAKLPRCWTASYYEAPNAEAIHEAARRLNIPADAIVEVGSELWPEQFL